MTELKRNGECFIFEKRIENLQIVAGRINYTKSVIICIKVAFVYVYSRGVMPLGWE